MESRSSRSKSPIPRKYWDLPSQDGSFASSSADSQYSSSSLSESRSGSLPSEYLKTPRFTCRSPLDSMVYAAHKAFNGCFKKKKHREMKAAISSIQGQCARSVEGQSSKRGYLRRQATLCNCLEERLNSRNKTNDRDSGKPPMKKMTGDSKEHGHRSIKPGSRESKNPPIALSRTSLQPLTSKKVDGDVKKPSGASRFRRKKTRSLSEDLGKSSRYQHSWLSSRGVGAAA